MISIITAYYNRKNLFINTLESLIKTSYKGDYEVIAVDDGSIPKERLEDLIPRFPFLKIIYIEPSEKWYHNSCIPFNIGFKAAQGDKIIIQNPECLHFGDILAYTEKTLNEKICLSFACFSLDKTTTNNICNLVQNKASIKDIVEKNNHVVKLDGESGWYNHSKFRPEAFHFCTAISRKNIKDLAGFDEVFSLGIAYDDNELIWRIKKKGLIISFVDDEIALHQNHYSPSSSSFENRTYKELLTNQNKRLYNSYTKNKKNPSANTVSKLLPLSVKFYYLKLLIIKFKLLD